MTLKMVAIINFVATSSLLFTEALAEFTNTFSVDYSNTIKINKPGNGYIPAVNTTPYTRIEPVHVVTTPKHIDQAYSYLEQNSVKYGLNKPRIQLILKNQQIDDQQNKHLKFQQVHNAIPIWGRQVIVHINSTDSVYHVSGKPLTNIGELDTQPTITIQAAGNLALRIKQKNKSSWNIKSSELVILNKDKNNYLTYRLTLANGLLREFIFIEAHTGKTIHEASGNYTTD